MFECSLALTAQVLNHVAAWDAAQSLNTFDDGASRSNLLYWIATRPSVAPCPNCTLIPAGLDASESFSTPADMSPHCKDNLACFALGLQAAGDCCPQPGGHFLGCCPVLQ